MTNRNIFIVANNIEEIGGLQRVVHVYADMFHKAGNNVELIGIRHVDSPHVYRADPPYRTMTAVEGEYEPQRLNGKLKGKQRARVAERLEQQRVTAIQRLNERFTSVEDGILIVSQVWAMEWVLQSQYQHLPVIAQSHELYEASRGLTPGSQGSSRWRRIMKYYPDVDLVLLLTQADADKFEKDGLNNVGVLQNPLPFYPDRVSDLTAKTIITVGRYAREKDQVRLIEAFASVHRAHPDWCLRLVGDGPMEPVLRAKVGELGLEDVVDIAGPTDRVEDALLESSIFALSSDNEGLPVVLAEAMACGVPCVSFDCSPGVREIIANGEDGIIVPHQDDQALTDALLQLIEDEALRRRLGARARDNVRRFAPTEIMKQWNDVFEFVER